MQAQFDHIIYEKENGRVRVTLNRPDQLNPLSLQLMAELSEAAWEADHDDDVHCLIIKGAGRAFSAGYDLTGSGSDVPVSRTQDKEANRYRGARSLDDDAWHLERAQRCRMALFDMHKPVIAQVHGYCLAGGTDLAQLCDLIIAADDAVFGFPAVRDLGAPPNQMWLYNVGPQWAKRLLLTGDTITGAEAQQLGLALKAVPIEHLENEVEQLADRFAKIDHHLLSANKRIVNLGLELMGARTLQRLAAENDVRGHNAPGALAFVRTMMKEGIAGALRQRKERFPDGRARVNGPELRDADGRLIDD